MSQHNLQLRFTFPLLLLSPGAGVARNQPHPGYSQGDFARRCKKKPKVCVREKL